MNERLITIGIEELDRDLNGFSIHQGYLISGATGTGKTVFSIQFLREGLLKEEKVILMTERQPESILNFADNLQLPLESYTKTGDLAIIRQVTQSSSVIDGPNEFTNFITDLGNLIVPLEATRIVFDSFVPIIQLFSDEYIEEGVTNLFNELRQFGLTFLLTTLMPTSRKTLAIRKAIESKVAGSIHFDEHLKENQEVNRKLVVRKMNGIDPPFPVYNFEITQGKGIDILQLNKTGLSVPKAAKTSKREIGEFKFSEAYKEESNPTEQIRPFTDKHPKKAPPRRVSFTDKIKEDHNLLTSDKSPAQKREAKDKITFKDSFMEKDK